MSHHISFEFIEQRWVSVQFVCSISKCWILYSIQDILDIIQSIQRFLDWCKTYNLHSSWVHEMLSVLLRNHTQNCKTAQRHKNGFMNLFYSASIKDLNCISLSSGTNSHWAPISTPKRKQDCRIMGAHGLIPHHTWKPNLKPPLWAQTLPARLTVESERKAELFYCRS